MRWWRWGLGLAVLLAAWQGIRACSPRWPVAVFSYARHPDLPRSSFLDGELGVLRPGFARSYLVVAYRHLTGVGFSGGEKERVRDYWRDRATGKWDRSDVDWQEKWEQARSRAGAKPAPARLLTGGTLAYDKETHAFHLNCAEDAFRTAIHTLEERGAKHGMRSRAVTEWLKGQDQVFANCDAKTESIPGALGAEWPAWLRADREYQIAAACFYARKYEEATARFRRIAANAKSPWRQIANYLVMRSLFRLAQDKTDAPPAVEAQKVAATILADPSLERIHSMTETLLRRLEIRKAQPEFFDRLASRLSRPGQEQALRDDLWVYTSYFDHYLFEDYWVRRPREEKFDWGVFHQRDLTDWIFNFQGKHAESGTYSLAKWRKTRSLPWLLAAISRATPESEAAGELMEAAARVPASSPGYATAEYHRMRLLVENGSKEQAREELDRLLEDGGKRIGPSSVNLFQALRMSTARNLVEFLGCALRRPVLITEAEDIAEKPMDTSDGLWDSGQIDVSKVRFDRDATDVLNERTPLVRLVELALSDQMPGHLRRDFALTTFTRAVMLEDQEALDRLRPKLAELMPERKDLVLAATTETTAEAKRFADVFLLLHLPEARPYYLENLGRRTEPGHIDNFKFNWWCALDRRMRPDIAARRVEFFSDEDRARGSEEHGKLASRGCGVDFLGGETLAYARGHTRDPRVAEALHRTVRANKFSCVDKETWRTTQEAFSFLHRHYPKSVWAAKTQIWNRGQTGMKSFLDR